MVTTVGRPRARPSVGPARLRSHFREDSMTQVCVTGMGAITPLGHDLAETWGAMVEGVSGVATVASFDPEGLATTIAAEVQGFDAAARLGRKSAHRMARFSQFAMIASQEAVAHADLDVAAL